jgi:hypothetical protein
MKIELPEDYWAYLESDEVVSEGFADGFPGYFSLWHPDEIEESNLALDVVARAPGFLGFGSNGAGEMLAFDTKGTVYSLPMIGMEPRYATKIADSWTEFRKRIRNERPY